ncbi:1,4-dihydroxy-2-naphthoate octaprenyltransferase [Candidatus Karelsulcia muelleri]|uniref:1,4-dihydroxy-2-naphthoate octaprenyltransferase n=1 Tax=Candidatus Karelsulcia muelleri TaxID=336810 RepID=UPI000D7C96BE|nr:1,4-dihydroxy-2-naphthoate octaprenyltransferase [Candidatus Karelsulcia muelleri]
MLEIYNWIYAFRLKTLPLSLSGLILSTFIFFSKKNLFNRDIFIWSSFTSIFLQILSNIANDYGDCIKGTDNITRIGPKRTIQSGILSKKKIKLALIIISCLSFFSNIILLFFSFNEKFSYRILLFLIGIILCIYSAITYTIGKNPYGYKGLGDLSVFIFFGLISLEGNYYLYNHFLNKEILLLGISLGFLTVSVLNINNMRDIDNDNKNGKYTLPVRIGLKKAKIYHIFLMIVPFLLSILYVFLTYKSISQYLFIILIIPTIRHLRIILNNHKEFNYEFNRNIYINILYTFLMGVGHLL